MVSIMPNMSHSQFQTPAPHSPPPKENSFFSADLKAVFDITVAKEAVSRMGIPDHLIQLVIDSRKVHHEASFTSVTDLYLASEDVSTSQEKQADLAMKLYLAKELQEKKLKEKKATEDAISLEVTSCHSSESAIVSSGMSNEACAEKKASLNKCELKERVRRLAKENRKLRDRKMCRTCSKVELSTSGITFLPCGHFITCEACSEKFDDCPACGKNIMGTVKTFLS